MKSTTRKRIMSMTTYAIFGGSRFYPRGGFNDIYAFCETFQEALIIYEEALNVGSKNTDTDARRQEMLPCDWAHIVNLKSQKIVVNDCECKKPAKRRVYPDHLYHSQPYIGGETLYAWADRQNKLRQSCISASSWSDNR